MLAGLLSPFLGGSYIGDTEHWLGGELLPALRDRPPGGRCSAAPHAPCPVELLASLP